MDRQFLKLISEAYLVDSDIKEDKNYYIDKIYNYLVKVVENIKYNDYNEYMNLMKMSRKHQQEILYDIISEDIFNVELVHEDFLDAIASGFKIAKALPETVFRLFFALNKTAEDVKNFVSHNLKGEQARIATNILYRRLERCSKECGVVSSDDLATTAPLALFKKGVYSESARIQADCLAKCYLKYHAEMITLFAKQYKECIKKTTQKDINASINMFIEVPLSPLCNTYHDLGMKYMDEFKKTLKILYSEGSSEYNEMLEYLSNSLEKLN